MILIADSGATTTNWLLVKEREDLRTFETIGFNPFFINAEGIKGELDKNLLPYIDNKYIRKVFFYGAGCSTPYNIETVSEALEDFFYEAEIYIGHDLTGAARALFFDSEGIACILGTGSNSCHYNGKEIVENVPSLGYLLADEGGGAYLGKIMLRDYFFGSMPENISKAFEEKYHFTLARVLETIYHKPFPNRFMASLVPFLKEYASDNYTSKILHQNFHDFFQFQVIKYKHFREKPLGFIGSVAYYFQDVLHAVAEEYKAKIHMILQNPLDRLAEYHLRDI